MEWKVLNKDWIRNDISDVQVLTIANAVKYGNEMWKTETTMRLDVEIQGYEYLILLFAVCQLWENYLILVVFSIKW